MRYQRFFTTDGEGDYSELVFDDGVNPPVHATFPAAMGAAVAGETLLVPFGSLRQNLMLGHPHATEQEMLQALHISGAITLVQQDVASLGRIINEVTVGTGKVTPSSRAQLIESLDGGGGGDGIAGHAAR